MPCRARQITVRMIGTPGLHAAESVARLLYQIELSRQMAGSTSPPGSLPAQA